MVARPRLGCRSIFVQPHFDDVALSCGGTVAAMRASGGAPAILTVFAEGPDPATPLGKLARYFHFKWHLADIVTKRLAEDDAAAAILGATPIRLPFREAIYRSAYDDLESLTRGAPVAADDAVRDAVAAALLDVWRMAPSARYFLPLGVGGHVDHVIVFDAAETLERAGAEVVLYEDFPYVLTPGALDRRIAEVGSLEPEIEDVSSTFASRVASVLAYRSQLATVFGAQGDPEASMRGYAAQVGANGDVPNERRWKRAGRVYSSP